MSKKKNLHSTQKAKQTAVLVAVINKRQPPEKAEEYLDELEFLATTMGLKTVEKFIQRLDQPDKRLFVGKGKFEEIKAYIKAAEVDVLIFDDDLSPSQVRNIEKELEIQIYDRSLLILDIFLARAQTAQAKTQVELARSQYLLPRLTNMWSHLERQRGGTGTRGGSGEKELETDRRMIRDKISVLKKKLDKIDQQNRVQRSSRGGMIRVSLVGYTNVGKSTIMNVLTKSNVFAENKLFATVDSTVRKVVLDNVPFLLSDTVGFIRKLPHDLIECFKSTLDEIRESDLVLHVVDISHPLFEEQIQVVKETMSDIGCGEKKQILVFNKIDAYKREEPSAEDLENMDPNQAPSKPYSLTELEKMYLADGNQSVIFISAINRTNLDTLRSRVTEVVAEDHYKRYPNYLA